MGYKVEGLIHILGWFVGWLAALHLFFRRCSGWLYHLLVWLLGCFLSCQLLLLYSFVSFLYFIDGLVS